MKNKLLAITLLFTCLGSSVAWAQYRGNDDFSDDTSCLKNTRVAVDFGFGLPWGYALKDALKDNKATSDISFSPNFHVGLLGSYTFPITDTFSMGPEIGINYGFTRKVEDKNHGGSIEEKYMKLPLYARFTFLSEPQSFLVSNNLVIGADLNIFLSSAYKQTGSSSGLDASFMGDKNDLYTFITDLPKLSGTIVIGNELEFPKGFYLAAKLRIPMELFTLLKEKDKKDHEKLGTTYIQIVRALTTNLVEFSVGLDIMRLIVE